MIAILLLTLFADGVSLCIDTNATHDLTATVAGGEAAIETTGGDPYVMLEPFDPGAVKEGMDVLSLEYFCPQGVSGLWVYYGPPHTAERTVFAGPMPPAEGWRPIAINLREVSEGKWTPRFSRLRLDPGQAAGVSLRLRNIQLRQPTEQELADIAEREAVRAARQAHADVLTQYFHTDLPADVKAVEVSADEVVIRGESPTAGRLIEIPPWTGSASSIPMDGANEVAAIEAGEFVVRLSRDNESEDRVTSRFAVAAASDGQWNLLSHATYATEITAAHVLVRKLPKSIKGMGGVTDRGPLEELIELGIHNATLNVDVNRFLHLQPGPNRTPFEHAGRTWYADDRSLERYDRILRFLDEHDVVATAIILVRFGDREIDHLLRHPAARTEGVYAMPDVDSKEGVAAYGAALSLLAERYARPGDPHGRISNWILHNEVDYARQWTNMGEQPMPVYLDAYVRSMRLAHNIARRHNPHARVFISLTHRWNLPVDETWMTYAPRRMLEMLSRMSAMEGDFAWGVAYHPYPQSLLVPTPWADSRPTDDFDTPLITPKNLPVLCRWMKRPEMRTADGRVRSVLLSEQGFHTPDYSEESQRTQAAAFLYTWDKLRECDCVEAFHNHRWIDAAGEGGLYLGLRTLPDADHPNGQKKLAWDVYRDLGTKRERDWRPLLEEVASGRE